MYDLHHFLWQLPHCGLDLWDFDQVLHGFHHLCALLQGSSYTHYSCTIHTHIPFTDSQEQKCQERILARFPLTNDPAAILTKLIPHWQHYRVHVGFGRVKLCNSMFWLNHLLCKNHTHIFLALFGSVFDRSFNFFLFSLNVWKKDRKY